MNWLFFPYITNLLLHKESHWAFVQNTEQVSYSSQRDKIHLNMSVSSGNFCWNQMLGSTIIWRQLLILFYQMHANCFQRCFLFNRRTTKRRSALWDFILPVTLLIGESFVTVTYLEPGKLTEPRAVQRRISSAGALHARGPDVFIFSLWPSSSGTPRSTKGLHREHCCHFCPHRANSSAKSTESQRWPGNALDFARMGTYL